MSWLTDWMHRKTDLQGVLVKTAQKLQDVTGIHLTDGQADAVAAAVDKATNDAEAAFTALIASKFPSLPGAVATIAVHAGLSAIDAAAAGAMNVVKQGNADAH